MTTRTRTLSALGVLGLALGLGACQPRPGDYRVYRVASLPDQLELDCFEGEVDPNYAQDGTSFFSAASVAVFATDKDTYFVEFGGNTLTGTRSGKDYAFTGEDVDVEVMGELTVTQSTSLELALEISGREIYGEYTVVERNTCSGDGCDALGGDYRCTRRGSFFGAEVKDVDLEYSVDGEPAGGAPGGGG